MGPKDTTAATVRARRVGARELRILVLSIQRYRLPGIHSHGIPDKQLSSQITELAENNYCIFFGHLPCRLSFLVSDKGLLCESQTGR